MVLYQKEKAFDNVFCNSHGNVKYSRGGIFKKLNLKTANY